MTIFRCSGMSDLWVANLIDRSSGQSARRVYLQQAYQSCPRYLTEPNMHGMKTLLQSLQTAKSKILAKEKFLLTRETVHNMHSWKFLLVFKIEDELSAIGHVCESTKECANMFIRLSEQIVQFHEDVGKFLISLRAKYQPYTTELRLVTLLEVSDRFEGIAHIWLRLQKEGKALRTMIQYVCTSLSEFDLNGLAGQRRWKAEDGLSLGG